MIRMTLNNSAQHRVFKFLGALIVFCAFQLPLASTAHAQLGGTIILEEQPLTSSRIIDGLAWTVAKTAIQSLTQSTVKWINSGFDGEPAYITDLSRNLSRLADTVADDFIRQLDGVVQSNTGVSLRAPFQDQIAAQLREEFYRTTSSHGFDVRNPYTLGNYSSNPAAFTGGDFSQGGLDGWQAAGRMENNPYGRYMLARNELVQQLDKAAKEQVEQLGWGNGFLPWRGSCGNTATQPTQGGVVSTATNLAQRDTTRGCPVRTPGALIERAIGITTDSPLRQLELADSMNEIVGALMGQLVGQVLGGGGLSGVSRPASGGGSSYIDRATNPSASLSGGFAQNIRDTQMKMALYQTGWQRVATAARNAQQACSSNASKRTQAEQEAVKAEAYQREATETLATLAQIETERIRLTGSATNESSAVNRLVTSFTNLLSGSGAVTTGDSQGQDTGTTEPGSLYSQMQRLAASCR
jgi:hypothetical protein